LRVLHQFIAGLPQGAVVAIATVALAVVGLLDYLTGFEISFGLFYLVPVCTVGWYHGRRAGIVFACLSSVVWYGVELAGGYPYHHALIPVWNAAVRFGFFVIIALLVAALRGRLAAERRLARTDALTGVMNKRAFAEQLDRDLALARRLGMPIALAYVDLDDFKQANELYGHAGGDEVLRMVGDRWGRRRKTSSSWAIRTSCRRCRRARIPTGRTRRLPGTSSSATRRCGRGWACSSRRRGGCGPR
jgi:predicted signal transduction protein with EAL and GGDEF domain